MRVARRELNISNEMLIQGLAVLCFDNTGKWLKGSIETQDGNQFTLSGTQTNKFMEEGDQCCNCLKDADLDAGELFSYNIHVVDTEIAEEFTLKRVHATIGANCSFNCASLKFEPQQILKGQRAELFFKQFFGENVRDQNTVAFSGQILLNVVSKPVARHWIM